MILFGPPEPYRFWMQTRDRDPELLPLVNRHYYRKASRSTKHGFVGPGRSIVLRTPRADAVFIWLWSRPEMRGDKLDCYYCVAFRNESGHLSSQMIKEAMQVATEVWGPPPKDGFVTYVDPLKVRSTNPGYCFLKAGWRRVGKSKTGKILLQAKQ
jgi:hypothetical protein